MRAQSGGESVILVTGADGLIGGALVRKLREHGRVVAAGNLTGVGGTKFDLDSPARMQVPAGVRLAFLCAWRGGVVEAARDPQGTRRTNVEGNAALIGKLRASRVKMVFLSTSLVFSGDDSVAGAPTHPCCTYGEQKAEIESMLNDSDAAIVRLTKVGETLLPRLREWIAMLRAEKPIAAAGRLRVAPVMLDDVVTGLAELARSFSPGIFQISAQHDQSYRELAGDLAVAAGFARTLVSDDPNAGADIFDPLPVSGRLSIIAPCDASAWPTGADCSQLLVERAVS